MGIKNDITLLANIKLAASAWKDRFYSGALSDSDIARLEDAKILDRSALLSGIETGNENLKQRLDITEIEGSPKFKAMGGYATDPTSRTIYTDRNSSIFNKRGPGAGQIESIIAPSGKKGVDAFNDALDNKVPDFVKRKLLGPAPTGGITPKELSDQLHPILKRHEIDEVRAVISNAKKGRTNQFKDILTGAGKGIKRIVPKQGRNVDDFLNHILSGAESMTDGPPVLSHSSIYSHFDPSVLAQESMNVNAVPDPRARKFMHDLRGFTGEAADLSAHGIPYGGKTSPSRFSRVMDWIRGNPKGPSSRKDIINAGGKYSKEVFEGLKSRLLRYLATKGR